MEINDDIGVNQLMFSTEECFYCCVLVNAYGLDSNHKFHSDVLLYFVLENPTIEDLKNKIIEEFQKKVNQKD